MKYIGWFLALILLLALGISIFRKPEPKKVYLDKIVTKTDTIVVVDYIKSDPVYIEKEVTIHDTIFITTSGDSVETELARLDTVFQDSAKLSVSYYLAPRVYDISYYPAPVKSKTVTIKELETVYVDSSAWWDNALVGGVGGSLFTAIIVSLVK